MKIALLALVASCLVAGCATKQQATYNPVTAWRERIEAMPPGPERTAATREFNSYLSQTWSAGTAATESMEREEMYRAVTRAANASQTQPAVVYPQVQMPQTISPVPDPNYPGSYTNPIQVRILPPAVPPGSNFTQLPGY